ncbi:hypothetical protein niasHS_000129 [Heterodera schachtii]|uniref:Uncharacterized protein n=1 Tax=Heterodera schachtii TaxID=97005 RepID=A0ABD2K6R4_HETSC
MSNIFKILLIVLLAVLSFSSSVSTDGKKTANDGSGSNSSAGIGTKIKRIVTAGLLFTSLATGGAEAIGRGNAQGGNAAGLVPSHVTNRSMAKSVLTGIKELHVVGGTDYSALAPKSDYQLGTATNFMYLSHWKDEQEEVQEQLKFGMPSCSPN